MQKQQSKLFSDISIYVNNEVGNFRQRWHPHSFAFLEFHSHLSHFWENELLIPVGLPRTHGTSRSLYKVYCNTSIMFLTFFLYISLFMCAFYRSMLCICSTSHGPVPVRPSVRPSVTSRSSTKTAKRRITQTTPHDSPGTLVFWSQRSPRNSTGVTPYGGAKCRWGGSKS